MSVLLDPFRDGLGQRALAEVVLLGLVCGPLGVWVLGFRQTYAAESLPHAALPGLVLAAAAGAPPLLGAAGGVLVAALLVAVAGRDARLGGELAVAVVVTTLTGAGALLALGPDGPGRLEALLFGDPLAAGTGDLAAAAALLAVATVALVAAHRPLSVVAFDPGTAPALGTRPARAEAALLLVLGLTLVVGVRALGALLVLALVVGPAAAARAAGLRLVPALLLAAGLGAAAGWAGLLASHHLDLAAGPAVALAAATPALLAGLLRPAPRDAGARRRSPLDALGV